MVKGSGTVVNIDAPVNLKTVEEVAQWAHSQFAAIERVLNDGAVYVKVVPIATEPPKPRDGMVVYANGDDWDPGADGDPGFFGYVNGVWERLDL